MGMYDDYGNYIDQHHWFDYVMFAIVILTAVIVFRLLLRNTRINQLKNDIKNKNT